MYPSDGEVRVPLQPRLHGTSSLCAESQDPWWTWYFRRLLYIKWDEQVLFIKVLSKDKFKNKTKSLETLKWEDTYMKPNCLSSLLWHHSRTPSGPHREQPTADPREVTILELTTNPLTVDSQDSPSSWQPSHHSLLIFYCYWSIHSVPIRGTKRTPGLFVGLPTN